jgi:hypothetical protein
MLHVASPILLIVLLSSLLALGLAVLAFRGSRWRARAPLAMCAIIFCLPAVWLFLGFHQELIDARIRAYKAFYDHVRVGMTRNDLSALLDRDFPAGGPRQRPKIVEETADHVSFCMSPEGERDPNCEGITVRLQDGQTIGKEYVRD